MSRAFSHDAPQLALSRDRRIRPEFLTSCCHQNLYILSTKTASPLYIVFYCPFFAPKSLVLFSSRFVPAHVTSEKCSEEFRSSWHFFCLPFFCSLSGITRAQCHPILKLGYNGLYSIIWSPDPAEAVLSLRLCGPQVDTSSTPTAIEPSWPL